MYIKLEFLSSIGLFCFQTTGQKGCQKKSQNYSTDQSVNILLIIR
jgi:hypothetical protein